MGICYLLVFLSLFVISGTGGQGNSHSASDCNYCISDTCTPTITAATNFSPRRDRLQIHYELMGWGTATNKLISILTSRSELQRLQISEEYVRTGSTLTDDIADDTFGKSLGALQALTKPLPLFYAEELYQALYNKDFDALIEIMASLPSCAIRKISVIYRVIYGIYLSKHIASVTRPDFRDLMLNLAKGNRDQIPMISQEQIDADVKSLIRGGKEAALIVGHEIFTEVFTKRSFPQLKAIIEAYDTQRRKEDLDYKSIEKDIEDFFSGDIAKAYLAILSNVNNQHEYFARELESTLLDFSMAKNSRKLIRILRGRCELDLEDIKRKYLELFRKSLASRIHRQADEEFEKSLFGILNER